MRRKDLFSISVCVLMDIWCTWIWSCRLSWGSRTGRNMVRVCLSRWSYLPRGLMALIRSSHGLHTYLYRPPPSHLLKITLISLAGRLPRCWYGRPSQWRGVCPNRAPPPLPLVFTNLRRWNSPKLICDFHVGSSQLGHTSCLPPLLATGVIGNHIVLSPLFCLFTHGE